jgi:Ca-activated chloride channel family protein
MHKQRLALAIAAALWVFATGCATKQTEHETAIRAQTGTPQSERLVDADRERDKLDDGRANAQVEEAKIAQLAGATGRSEDAPRKAEEPEAASYAPPMTSTPIAADALAGLRAPPPPPPTGYWQPNNTEKYADHVDNPVMRVAETPVSTFSIDVDTGSYTNVRRMIEQGSLPPADAVRAEEFINYFDYAYAPPKTLDTPFSVTTEIAPAPWNTDRQLMLVGIKGYEVPKQNIPASNLVFLIDTSGSMDTPEKLPLLKDAFKLMTENLREQDRVAIVVYAGSAGMVLPPTPGSEREKILDALDQLSAGGSTNGAQGIELAYQLAQQAFIEDGVNRVILATDGDFNVGTVDTTALKTMVADKRKSGIALTTLGFGQDNYNDELAEQLADVGNGNHAYIDTLAEARKVLVEEMSSTLLTIAKDVKIQIEFNPNVVAEYRLIGYENRVLRREDFNNDKIDAGEIGAGHDVTALYELTMVGAKRAQIDPLRYGDAATVGGDARELAFLKLRYKRPNEDVSRLIERPIARAEIARTASERLRFAAAVAAFADALRGGTHGGGFGMDRVAELAEQNRDESEYRAQFVALVRKAAALQTATPETAIVVSE